MEDKLHQFYNENEEYFNLADEGHENIFPIHREILDKCKDKSGLIVELGCGTGIDSIAMSGKDNYVMGIDISELAIKKARKRAEGIEGVEFKESNLEALPLEDNSVDVIASFFTFEHLFNPERVLSEINRVLKNNGVLIIGERNRFSGLGLLKPFLERMNKWMYISDSPFIEKWYSKNKWQKLLNNNGYHVDAINSINVVGGKIPLLNRYYCILGTKTK